jgi:hypothetical protein
MIANGNTLVVDVRDAPELKKSGEIAHDYAIETCVQFSLDTPLSALAQCVDHHTARLRLRGLAHDRTNYLYHAENSACSWRGFCRTVRQTVEQRPTVGRCKSPHGCGWVQ